MFNESTLQPVISMNGQGLISGQKLGDKMDVNQPKEDFKIFPEEFYDAICHDKYVDSLLTEEKHSLLNSESPDQEVNETYPEASLVHLVETSALYLGDARADEDNKIEFSLDVNLSKREHSDLQEVSVETDVDDVKDICVDEGVPVKEKIHFEDIDKGLTHVIDDIYPTESEDFCSKNEKLDAEWLVQVGLKSSKDVTCEKDLITVESEDLICKNGSKNETKNVLLSDLLKKKDVDTFPGQNTAHLQLKTSTENGCKDEQCVGCATPKGLLTDNEVVCSKLVTSSPSPEKTNGYHEVETSDKKNEPGNETTANSSFLTLLVNNNEVQQGLVLNRHQLPEAASTAQLRDATNLDSDHLPASAPLQRDYFESSFASVGHYAGSITYSGPIAHSGSLSHRSDASTASTRSFAFPVLKNEWNFSPIRMRKAERRQRRNRRWMHDVICCRF